MSKLKDYLLPAIPVVIGLIIYDMIVKSAVEKAKAKVA